VRAVMPPPVMPLSTAGCGGDLTLVCQVVHIPERKENMLKLPGLVVEVVRMSGIEISNGGEEMGGVHGDAPLPRTPLPRTSALAHEGFIPCAISSLIRCSSVSLFSVL
jgi:hypothetical protein